ncbi:hypothetical protein DFJ73DRAFT_939775 [Zopfochytrium polystomum]|nr:hypothetical protein DFJ73DRAFT_939775 [Zopfochytrium polystomum]
MPHPAAASPRTGHRRRGRACQSLPPIFFLTLRLAAALLALALALATPLLLAVAAPVPSPLGPSVLAIRDTQLVDPALALQRRVRHDQDIGAVEQSLSSFDLASPSILSVEPTSHDPAVALSRRAPTKTAARRQRRVAAGKPASTSRAARSRAARKAGKPAKHVNAPKSASKKAKAAKRASDRAARTEQHRKGMVPRPSAAEVAAQRAARKAKAQPKKERVREALKVANEYSANRKHYKTAPIIKTQSGLGTTPGGVVDMCDFLRQQKAFRQTSAKDILRKKFPRSKRESKREPRFNDATCTLKPSIPTSDSFSKIATPPKARKIHDNNVANRVPEISGKVMGDTVPATGSVSEQAANLAAKIIKRRHKDVADVKAVEVKGAHSSSSTGGTHAAGCFSRRPGTSALPKAFSYSGHPERCGETMLAKGLAKESGANFLNVPVSSLVSKWIGDSEKLVHALFSFAKKIDSFLMERRQDDHDTTRRVVAEFLSMWDGLVAGGPSQILVLGATDRLKDSDAAFLRRMLKRLPLALPDAAQRKQILTLLVSKLDPGPVVRPGRARGARTDGLSGSELRELCSDAALAPLREAPARPRRCRRCREGLRRADAVTSIDRVFREVDPTVTETGKAQGTDWTLGGLDI